MAAVRYPARRPIQKGFGRFSDLRGATELLGFWDRKHRAGFVAGQVEDASRPGRGSRALLMLDGVAGGTRTPGNVRFGLGAAVKQTSAPGASPDLWRATLKDGSIARWCSPWNTVRPASV
jgi:hypothetical protein